MNMRCTFLTVDDSTILELKLLYTDKAIDIIKLFVNKN